MVQLQHWFGKGRLLGSSLGPGECPQAFIKNSIFRHKLGPGQNWDSDSPSAYLLLLNDAFFHSSDHIFPPSQNTLKTPFCFLLSIHFSESLLIKNFPPHCQICEKFSKEFTFSVCLFGYTLQYFLFIFSFLPATPAVNT